MHEMADRIVGAVESGRLSRREAVGKLVALAAATFAAGPARAESPPDRPSFRSVGLNHVALRVTDVERSSAFYREHLGLTPLQGTGPERRFLGAGRNHFVALFRSSKPGLDHYCYTIDDYDAGAVADRLESLGLSPRRTQNRVYFDDPDGIEVQLASEWGDYPGPRR